MHQGYVLMIIHDVMITYLTIGVSFVRIVYCTLYVLRERTYLPYTRLIPHAISPAIHISIDTQSIIKYTLRRVQ